MALGCQNQIALLDVLPPSVLPAILPSHSRASPAAAAYEKQIAKTTLKLAKPPRGRHSIAAAAALQAKG
jgi:hypothetical protein